MARCKYKENARYSVVCVRVTEEERETLERMSLQCNKRVSELLREALNVIAAAAADKAAVIAPRRGRGRKPGQPAAAR